MNAKIPHTLTGIFLVLLTAAVPLAAQAFQSLQIGTNGNDYGHAIGTDSKGNVYVAGWSEGDLGNADNTGYTYDGFGVFLMKLSPAGKRIFIRQLGDKEHEWVYALAVDRKDCVYVTGSTKGSLPGNKQNGPVTQFGGAGDAFLIKFDPNGKTLWVRQWGKPGRHDASEVWQDGYDAGNAVAVDSANNVYVAGTSGGTFDLAFESNAFVSKFDSNGKKLWETEIATPERDEAYGLTIDGRGDIIVAGATWGTLEGRASAGKYDVLVAKLNAGGKKKWQNQFGSAARDIAYAVATDRQNNLYLTGYMESDFLNNRLGGGNQDAFLVKLSDSGEISWAKFLGGTANETGHDIAVSQKGDIYVTGKAALGPGNAANWSQAAENSDCFLARFDSQGNQKNLVSWGSPSDDEAFNLTIDRTGNIWVTGAVFGSLDGAQHMGVNDVFVKKFAPLR